MNACDTEDFLKDADLEIVRLKAELEEARAGNHPQDELGREKTGHLLTHEAFVHAANERDRLRAESSRLTEEGKQLREALTKLANEAEGFVSMANPENHGHTNVAVLRTRIAMARAALSSGDSEPSKVTATLEQVAGPLTSTTQDAKAEPLTDEFSRLMDTTGDSE